MTMRSSSGPGTITSTSTTFAVGTARAANSPLDVIRYEVEMYFGMRNIIVSPPAFLADRSLKNAIVESWVLHTRVLCDAFLAKTKGTDDIAIEDFLPNWQADARCAKVRRLLDDLRAAYGNNHQSGCPCWEFNKMLAHPTQLRGTSYDYGKAMAALYPHIAAIINELESLTGVRLR